VHQRRLLQRASKAARITSKEVKMLKFDVLGYHQ
jgi:hypothetical protein